MILLLAPFILAAILTAYWYATKLHSHIARMNCVLLISIVCAAMATFVGYTARSISIFWGPTVIYSSSSTTKNHIQTKAIPVPEKAYDLEFFYDAGKDHMCWAAFSATNNEIEKIIHDRQSSQPESDQQYTFTTLPEKPDYWIKDSSRGNWWPATANGLKIYAGNFYWIGHDTIRQRIYYYDWSM